MKWKISEKETFTSVTLLFLRNRLLTVIEVNISFSHVTNFGSWFNFENEEHFVVCIKCQFTMDVDNNVCDVDCVIHN